MVTKKFEFDNGDKVKDEITGFTGIITSISFNIDSRIEYMVSAKSKKKNLSGEYEWISENRLLLLKKFEG